MADDKIIDEKLDWFPFQWQRFLIGTWGMTTEEIGAYLLMLIHEWDKGFVPAEEGELKKICKVPVKKLQNVLKKFKNINGKLYNDTLEIIRIEQVEKHLKNSNRGSKGAKSRWDKHKESIAKGMLKHSLDDSIREEENRKEEIIKEESESVSPELQFQYMIGDDEILSIDDIFKEKFPVLFQTSCSQYGELKIKKWTEDFSNLHKQKTWKDYQDFRGHISNYFALRNQSKQETSKGKIETEYELNQKLHADHKNESAA
jgi:uncharacterized protein YdaU (DUF1376 family)